MMYHVMIIEDDPMVASINRQYVEATPSFQADRVFKSGAEALEYLKDHTTDLIILDYYTPLMNGDVFIDRLHAMGKTPAVIMVTSANDTDIVRSLLSRGVLDYLVKPISTADFSQTMDYYLSMKAKRSSHYIEVKESRVMVKIPIDTILYTDYFNHYIQIHLADRIVKTYMRFEDFSKLLLCYPQFISCYRNCIINLDKVVRLEKTSFVLTSGEHLPITRSLRLQIHQQYADYQFRKINGGIE